jgi:hypothetical protein
MRKRISETRYVSQPEMRISRSPDTFSRSSLQDGGHFSPRRPAEVRASAAPVTRSIVLKAFINSTILLVPPATVGLGDVLWCPDKYAHGPIRHNSTHSTLDANLASVQRQAVAAHALTLAA